MPKGGPVIQEAPEPLGDVDVEVLVDAPGVGSGAAQPEVIPSSLVFLLLEQQVQKYKYLTKIWNQALDMLRKELRVSY